MTLEEAAMQAVTNRVAHQPRLHVRRPVEEPQLVYTRGIYRPQPVYWRGTADSQGFSFIHNSSQDSHTRDLLNRTNEDDEYDDDEMDDEYESPGLAAGDVFCREFRVGLPPEGEGRSPARRLRNGLV